MCPGSEMLPEGAQPSLPPSLMRCCLLKQQGGSASAQSQHGSGKLRYGQDEFVP